LFITLQWFYAVLCIALSIPMAIIKWYYSFKMFQLEKELVPVEREANYLHQILTWVTHAKEVRVFGYGSSFIKKFKAIKWDVFKKRRKLNARQNLFSLLSELFEIIVIAFVFIMLAKGAWEKTISVGVFVIYLQGFQRLQGAAKGLLQSIVQLLQQRLFLRDLFGFLDIQSYHSDLKNTNFPTLQK
ncbi:ABC transporter ATP-binding protein, partial [Thermococcus sp. M36]|uniref:ABC transporter ATP-binding protein n=1 Tax=Thermococcus sp. M36 TaxID=1638261 RepID=UPI00143B376C